MWLRFLEFVSGSFAAVEELRA